MVIFDPSIINVKPYVGIKELCTRTQETYFQLKFGLRQFQEGRLGYILGFVVIVQRQEIGEGRDTRGRSVFTHEYNSCSQLTSLLLWTLYLSRLGLAPTSACCISLSHLWAGYTAGRQGYRTRRKGGQDHCLPFTTSPLPSNDREEATFSH